MVLAAYLSAGLTVSVPFGTGAPYDLIVDTGKAIVRVQVKTGWYRKGCVNYKGRRRIRDSTQKGMRGYYPDEVDYFAVYYPPSGQIFVIPCVLQSGDGCLRLIPALNSQTKKIRWASDFTWEKHLAELRQMESKLILHSAAQARTA